MSATDHFSQDTTGLSRSRPTEIVEVAPGGSYELRIAPVTKRIGDAEVRMLAYNGSVPGPTLRVAEGSQIEVDVVNEGDLEATVHWHGLRLDNRSDGTHETQAPIPVGGRYSCTGVPGPRPVLVPPAHPRGLRAGARPLRQRHRRARRPGLLGAGQP